ncbi:DUF2778 domain-containing protein [Buttiauxella noackiae]|uniref:DUF2778 domain-containing protein n=1 Tax=Buttiauxella noackiae TaxID=82992 RepID=UPI000557FE7D|nr:DUF2778 domain-containing protein [Buttiauxella noackiae]
MIRCTFHLNGAALSTLSCPGVGFFPAYSGNAGPMRNNPDSIKVKDVGPLPPGQYYIVSRGRGGIGTMVNDLIASEYTGSDRGVWFTLYRNDSQIDDHTFIEEVQRGNFRLHPAGYEGRSNGCITLPRKPDFMLLRESLLKTAAFKVTASLTAFGTIQVN